jgi:hypothetical protein
VDILPPFSDSTSTSSSNPASPLTGIFKSILGGLSWLSPARQASPSAGSSYSSPVIDAHDETAAICAAARLDLADGRDAAYGAAVSVDSPIQPPQKRRKSDNVNAAMTKFFDGTNGTTHSGSTSGITSPSLPRFSFRQFSINDVLHATDRWTGDSIHGEAEKLILSFQVIGGPWAIKPDSILIEAGSGAGAMALAARPYFPGGVVGFEKYTLTNLVSICIHWYCWFSVSNQ